MTARRKGRAPALLTIWVVGLALVGIVRLVLAHVRPDAVGWSNVLVLLPAAVTCGVALHRGIRGPDRSLVDRRRRP